LRYKVLDPLYRLRSWRMCDTRSRDGRLSPANVGLAAMVLLRTSRRVGTYVAFAKLITYSVSSSSATPF
jgi:hypothetical protein